MTTNRRIVALCAVAALAALPGIGLASPVWYGDHTGYRADESSLPGASEYATAGSGSHAQGAYNLAEHPVLRPLLVRDLQRSVYGTTRFGSLSGQRSRNFGTGNDTLYYRLVNDGVTAGVRSTNERGNSEDRNDGPLHVRHGHSHGHDHDGLGDGRDDDGVSSPSAVPLPASWMLFMSALLLIGGLRIRQARSPGR
jgi:hypothetical protein